eukprot:7376120-Prymnesium_polylepis.2
MGSLGSLQRLILANNQIGDEGMNNQIGDEGIGDEGKFAEALEPNPSAVVTPWGRCLPSHMWDYQAIQALMRRSGKHSLRARSDT